MTARERFLATLDFRQPCDRLPMVEWGAFWDKTLSRWQDEGLPNASVDETLGLLGMDRFLTIMAAGSAGAPVPADHGGPVAGDECAYRALKGNILSDETINAAVEAAQVLRVRHQKGEVILHLWLDGFFWFPRTLLGIEGHLYGFYDEPELMLQMNEDLLEFNRKAFERLWPVMEPDVVIFAEDISYNHGPMISRGLFDRFIAPYYKALLPVIKARGVKVLMDSDGDISSMAPWLLDAGLEGVGPLERQAGVDISELRRAYPRLILFGGYDKMVMSRGEDAMRAEFERILPVMRSGGYVPMVDHQTPPGVSLTQYRSYVRLLREYTQKAVEAR